MALFHTTVLDEQIKALPTVDTASGSIATFDTDMTENLVGCVCEVASGSNEINVYATGKNLFGGTLINGDLPLNLPPDTYSFSAINLTSDNAYLYVRRSTDAVTFDLVERIVFGTTVTPKTITLESGYIYSLWSNNNYARIGNVQIEKGSDVTTYEAYNGNTYNIPFGEILSGDGSFDFLSGILTRSDDTTKQLSANYIQTINGINNIWCDTNGDTSVKYILSVGKAIS